MDHGLLRWANGYFLEGPLENCLFFQQKNGGLCRTVEPKSRKCLLHWPWYWKNCLLTRPKSHNTAPQGLFRPSKNDFQTCCHFKPAYVLILGFQKFFFFQSQRKRLMSHSCMYMCKYTYRCVEKTWFFRIMILEKRCTLFTLCNYLLLPKINKVCQRYPNFIRAFPTNEKSWKLFVLLGGFGHQNFMNPFEHGKSFQDELFPKRFGTEP